VARFNGADGNGDGVVDAADYTVWRDALDATMTIAIPKPTTVALAAMLAVLFAGCQRKMTGVT
jgi:hypothetical protein